MEATYVAELAAIPDGPAKVRGVAVGEAAAAAILALRSDDGSDTTFLDFGYVPGPDPGDFQFIPGYPLFAAAPGWGNVTPFLLKSSSQYRPRRPYDVLSEKIRGGLQRSESLGAINSTTRTAEQEEIAMFWVEGSPQPGTGSRESSLVASASISGSTRASLDCSTWRRRTRISQISRTSISTSSGDRSPRSALPERTAIRIRSPTWRGIRWCPRRRRPTIRPDTAGRGRPWQWC